MSLDRRSALVLLFASLAAGAGARALCPAFAGDAAPADPRARPEHVTSELVLIEAYVTDLKGRPIKDLSTQSFVLLVDGKAAPIASLEYREWPREPAAGPQEAPGSADAFPGTDIRLAARRFALFFEDDVSAPQGLTAARGAAMRFISSRLDPSDQVALVAHGKTLQVLQDFTADRASLAAALERSLHDTGRVSDYTREFDERDAEMREIMRQPGGLGSKIHRLRFAISSYASRDEPRLRRSLAALRALIAAMASWPGYKAIVYMGDGLSENPAQYYLDRLHDIPALRTPPDDAADDLLVPVELHDLSIETKTLIDAADAAGVTLNTIDTGGLSAGNASSVYAARHRSASLQAMALNTGGLASFSNDPFKGLSAAEESSRSYYVIGYAPPGEPDGLHHAVLLRLKGRTGELRWRRGFERLRPEEARERMVQSAHQLPEFYPALGLDLAAVPGPVEGANRVLDLVLHVPPGQVLFLPEAGRPTARLEVSLVVLDEARRETFRLGRALRIALPSGAPAGGPPGLDLFHRVRLPAGAQLLTAVLDDLSSGVVGGARVDVPAARSGGEGLHGLALYSLGETSLWVDVGGETTGAAGGSPEDYHLGPALKTVFEPGEALACGFKLPPPRDGGAAAFRLAIMVAGEGRRTIDLPPETLKPDRSFHVPLSLDGLASGRYRLVVQEVGAEGTVDRASLPFRIR